MVLAFDGSGKTITVTSVSELTAIEVYSDWKEWVLLSDNAKYLKAFRLFSGDPTSAGQYAPSYFFLTNGWRLIITNLDLAFGGNLYTEEGDSPFVNTDSNITHKTSDASTVSTGGGSGGLTTEEHNKLMSDLTEDDFLALK